MGAHRSRVAGGATGWPSSDYRSTLCRERHPLPIADRVPVAPSAAPVPSMGNGLFLFPQLGGIRRMGAAPSHRLLVKMERPTTDS